MHYQRQSLTKRRAAHVQDNRPVPWVLDSALEDVPRAVSPGLCFVRVVGPGFDAVRKVLVTN